MEVPNFLSLYGQDSIRSPQVSGFRLPLTMETEKNKAGFTSALLTEDYLHVGENGGSHLKRCLAVQRRMKDLLRIAPDQTTYRPSIQGH